MADPIVHKSNIETDDPKREMPQSDNADPTRVKPRSDKEDPRCKKSSIEIVEPKRT